MNLLAWPKGLVVAAVIAAVVMAGPVGQARASGRLRIALQTTGQRAAVAGGQLRLTVTGPRGTRLRVSARARRTAPHAPSLAPGAIVYGIRTTIGGAGWRRLALRLTPTGRRVLARCVSVRVILSARVLGRTRLAHRPGRGRAAVRSRRRAAVRTAWTERVLQRDPRRCPFAENPPSPTLALTGGVAQAPPVGAHGERTLVGAATRSITPPSSDFATHVGGYGDCQGCDKTNGTTRVTPGDDLRVRAVVVRRGSKAVVLATADLEGWFAGYKQGPNLGLLDLRKDVATDLSRPVSEGGQGLALGPQDVIVQSVHCHACPTVVGIWGPTNSRYLQFIYAQMRGVIADAAAQARPAALEWATSDIGYINDLVVGQANANEGWPLDGQLSILHATDTRTGRTIATYANVPAHGNIVHGPSAPEMSSEYFGASERWLEDHVGGVAVVGPGTLGDQTTPLQGVGGPNNSRPLTLSAIDSLGALVGATVYRALSQHPHSVTDPTLGGAETYLVLPFTNPALSGSDCQQAITQVVGIQIDRSCDPPYAIASTGLGVWFTTLRIGSVAVASEPGEAFPHVTFGVRRALSGAAVVFTPGQAQDQLGYYYEPWAFPTTFMYSADHNIFHASMALAEANAHAQLANGSALGFSVTPTLLDPTGNDFTRLTMPGIQVWAYPSPDGSTPPRDPTVQVSVYRAPARCTQDASQAFCSTGNSGDAGPVTVDFGDGSPPVTASTPKGGPTCCLDLRHTFPRPGDYEVTAKLEGGQSWTTTVHLTSPLLVSNSAHYPKPGTVFGSPGQAGGG